MGAPDKDPVSAMKLLLEAEREALGQLICDDEQSQCHIGNMTGGNIGAAGLNAALKQQAILTELSDNVASFEDELFLHRGICQYGFAVSACEQHRK